MLAEKNTTYDRNIPDLKAWLENFGVEKEQQNLYRNINANLGLTQVIHNIDTEMENLMAYKNRYYHDMIVEYEEG